MSIRITLIAISVSALAAVGCNKDDDTKSETVAAKPVPGTAAPTAGRATGTLSITADGKQYAYAGTACLSLMNSSWFLSVPNKEIAKPCDDDADDFLEIELPENATTRGEDGWPNQVPQRGMRLKIEGASNGEGTAPEGDVTISVVKVEKPYVYFELSGFTPSEYDREDKITAFGGSFRALVSPDLNEEDFYKAWK